MATSLHDLNHAELQALLVADGVRAAHVGQLWNALHFRAETGADLLAREDFSPPLRRWVISALGGEGAGADAGTNVDAGSGLSLGSGSGLAVPGVSGSGRYVVDVPEVASDIPSGDGLTRKFLLRLRDGQEIETVVMGYPGRFTACVSTQAGCAMGCVFCATGQMGFVRHLRPGEIVAQVLHAQRVLRAKGERLRNLVLMGMGEPLHNYDSVMKALEIITDTRGINIGPSRISISTVGVVPGILRMAEEERPYSLAVSLHGSCDEERGALLPANQRWPLSELMGACRVYGEKTGKRIFFAWTLIAGVNDTPAHALRVAGLLKGLNAHVNLIPLNETEGYAGRESAEAAADVFQRILLDAGFPCTIRQRRGIDVAAGCGQLKATKRKRQAVAV